MSHRTTPYYPLRIAALPDVSIIRHGAGIDDEELKRANSYKKKKWDCSRFAL